MLSAEQVPMMRNRCQEPANKYYELTTQIANGVCVCVCVCALVFFSFLSREGECSPIFFSGCFADENAGWRRWASVCAGGGGMVGARVQMCWKLRHTSGSAFEHFYNCNNLLTKKQDLLTNW